MESHPPPAALTAVRALAWALLALLLVVTTTSAWVRLAQAGLSCAGAPDCYATKAARVAADASTVTAVARTLHRMAASAAGAVIVAMLFFGWRAGTTRERAVIVALLVFAAALATLGRYTPSTLPAVTLGNLLGGMAMAGIAAWLARALERRPADGAARALRPGLRLALALVALQIALGGMISAHHAAWACDGALLCDGRLWPPGAGIDAFDPWRDLAPPGDAASRSEPARQAVLIAHRLLALPTLLVLAWVGVRARRAGLRGTGRALLVLVALQAGLGIGQSALGHPLALAVAHNVVAALVVVTLGTLLGRCGSGGRD